MASHGGQPGGGPEPIRSYTSSTLGQPEAPGRTPTRCEAPPARVRAAHSQRGCGRDPPRGRPDRHTSSSPTRDWQLGSGAPCPAPPLAPPTTPQVHSLCIASPALAQVPSPRWCGGDPPPPPPPPRCGKPGTRADGTRGDGTNGSGGQHSKRGRPKAPQAWLPSKGLLRPLPASGRDCRSPLDALGRRMVASVPAGLMVPRPRNRPGPGPGPGAGPGSQPSTSRQLHRLTGQRAPALSSPSAQSCTPGTEGP